MRVLFASFAFLALGCGGSIASVDAADASAPDASAAGADASVRCPWENGIPQEPSVSYDKHCATTADCAIGLHLQNCCGQHVALGVNVADAPRFARAGGVCGDEYPMCKCLAGGTIAEDGKLSMSPSGADIVVACVAGACVTHIAP